MTLILNIETSGEFCSVAVSENDKVLIAKETCEKNSHSTKLAPLTYEVLEEINIKPEQINAISISKGPGSYTGLRIGTSFAKGLSYSLNIPLISVDTLKLMCATVAFNNTFNSDSMLCPMIDARRMEVYTAMYDVRLNQLKEIIPLILNEQSFEQYVNNSIYFFGSGMLKWKEFLNKKMLANYHFIPDIYPKAEYMTALSYQIFKEKKFEDVAYYEPFYLKEFIAGIPTKNKLF